ncbi:MAG: PLDc N-terminal domain-containing protein [Prevotellaceae bacterium]|jgi:hypothetical protein|nr:PLDc N-terminal domain-containing protein [Prevotellaceae bacterium]
MGKYIFILLSLLVVYCYIAAIVSIAKRLKSNPRSVNPVWLWVILLLPVAGPAIYLFGGSYKHTAQT